MQELSLNYREIVSEFQKKMEQVEGLTIGNNPDCPLEHNFTDGFYLRTIRVPKGFFVITKVHLHPHPVFVESGRAFVVSEVNGEEIIEGPKTMISQKGVQRLVFAETDLVWTTVHLNPTNETDIETLEKQHVCWDYDEYTKLLNEK
jgi:hypothetical protein